MAYSFLTQATVKKLSRNEKWLQQINNEDIIDLSLNAGQLIIDKPKVDENFIPFSQQLDVYCQQIAQQFPFIAVTPQLQLHCTLLTIFNQPIALFEPQKLMLLAWCQKITNIFNKIGKIEILFNDIILTANGSVILIGVSKTLTQFRQQVYQQIPIDHHLHKNIIHITLGRLQESVSSEKITPLFQFLAHNRLSLPINIKTSINYPKFVVSKGSLSSEILLNKTIEFNQQKQ
ncbi:hypothetical protein [Proteus mirabilis]|uniref:hypothetical protein n=1 Tax=Proteus mirabilis TaxID=584 RepID=UPI003314FA02